jgi:hypothetical protein
MVHILAAGVYLSGFVKDLLCLPRPLSPPLTRITMSGSAALEYGFPSTHSTNAVSVAYYVLYMLKYNEPSISPTMNNILQASCYVYASSIILGRLYCGMHGFFDVIVGSALGALISAVQCWYGPTLDEWLYSGPLRNVLIVIFILLVLVRVHPEPADNCPCYDDSVAFLAVFLGCEFASWHYARRPIAWKSPPNVPFELASVGWLIAISRIVVGVLVVFAWRGVMKPALLKTLPPLFRIIEQLGLDAPRRFFTKASQYTTVPRQRNDDNVIPSARDIPGMLSNLRRRRAVSIGPQSEADAYETLAYREKQRRNSHLAASPITSIKEDSSPNGYFHSEDSASSSESHTRKRSASLEEFRRQMGAGIGGIPLVAIDTPNAGLLQVPGTQQQVDSDEKELFANVHRPRVRYDVEVVTKLIVYTGIAWLAIEGNPVLFYHLGWSV